MTDSPLTRVLTVHYLRGWRAGHSGSGAICACGRMFVWFATDALAVEAYTQHVVALVAAETQVELARQFGPTSAWYSLGNNVLLGHYSTAMVESAKESRG